MNGCKANLLKSCFLSKKDKYEREHLVYLERIMCEDPIYSSFSFIPY